MRLSFLKVLSAAALIAASYFWKGLDSFSCPDSYAFSISFSFLSSFMANFPVLLDILLLPFCLG
jgi:hypothetical protein